MLKKLKKIEMKLYWIDDEGDKHEGCPSWISGNVSGIRGDVSWISGDVSGLSGDVSGIRGNVSGIRGNVSGIRGDVSGIRGNVDDCSITDEERKNGIDVKDLVGEINIQ